MAIDAFVSYSRVDRAKVEVLATALQRAPMVVVWDGEFAGGDEFAETIADSIRRANVFVLAVSEASMRSDWVSRELDAALTAGTSILPVMLDKTPLPPKVGHLSALDFRHWAGDVDADIVAKLVNDVRLMIATKKNPIVQMPNFARNAGSKPEIPESVVLWLLLAWSILVTGLGMSLQSSGMPFLGNIVMALGLLPYILLTLVAALGLFFFFGILPPLAVIAFGFLVIDNKKNGEWFESALFASIFAALTIFVTPGVWSTAGDLMERVFSQDDPATSAEMGPVPLPSTDMVRPNAPSTDVRRTEAAQSSRIAERASEIMASNSACDFASQIASGRNAAGEALGFGKGSFLYWWPLRRQLYGEPRQAWLERADLCETLDHERRDIAIVVAYCLRGEPIVEQSDWISDGSNYDDFSPIYASQASAGASAAGFCVGI